MSWGIRVRRSSTDTWQLGKQYRRVDGRWVFWRDQWPTRLAAQLRLRQYRQAGWRGHVFKIAKPPVYPTDTHYSEHFTRAELECKGPECAGKRPPRDVERKLTALARDLELLRTILGGALGVLSGYRCPVHNERVNGAVDSQHKYATAADLVVPNGHQDEYVAAAEQVPAFRQGGIGIYPAGGVHVDRRGWRARWSSWIGSR